MFSVSSLWFSSMMVPQVPIGISIRMGSLTGWFPFPVVPLHPPCQSVLCDDLFKTTAVKLCLRVYSRGNQSETISLPMQETQKTWGWSLGQEHTLEEEMETHPSILVRRVPWTEEPGRLQSMGSLRVRHDWVVWLTLTWKHVYIWHRMPELFKTQK